MVPSCAPKQFQGTRWSVVRRATSGDDPGARAALADLFDAYWYPIYAHVRRSGKSPHDAEDLTQGYFLRLIEQNTLAGADPAKGKLRSYLLGCLRHYMADEYDRAMALKRGAGVLTSFHLDWAEDRYAEEPVDNVTPDRLFQRRWALTVLEYSLLLLGEEFAAAGKAPLFNALRPFLGFGPDAQQRYDETAVALGMPLGTVKNHVHRMRERWRQIMFEQVGMTLDDPTPENIRAELAELHGSV